MNASMQALHGSYMHCILAISISPRWFPLCTHVSSSLAAAYRATMLDRLNPKALFP
jgi:hypothetical protein